GAIRAASGPSGFTFLLSAGVLPMVNLMVVGLLVGRRYPGSHHFLLGFEAFGAVALAFFVAGVSQFGNELVPYLNLVLVPYVNTFQPTFRLGAYPMAFQLGFCTLVVAMLGLPQLAFAVLGGLLSLRFWASKRPDRTRC